jgi:hypothetical protein
VDKIFATFARLASSQEFSLAKSENNWGSGEEESVRDRKKIASGFR